MFDQIRLASVCCGLAAALLLIAACGGQSSSTGPGPRHSASPNSSSAFAEPTSEPTAHPPALASPPTRSPSYTTAADAERFLSGNGLTAAAPQETWRPAATLHVIHATGANGADYQGDWYFFFVKGQLAGQQFFTHSGAQSPVDDSTFAVTYSVFQPGDPHCCASGGQATVRFHWNGTKLVTLDPMPGPIQT